jgi:hypothetical protein
MGDFLDFVDGVIDTSASNTHDFLYEWMRLLSAVINPHKQMETADEKKTMEATEETINDWCYLCKTKPCITRIYGCHLTWIQMELMEYETPEEKHEEKLLFFLMDKHVEHRNYFLAGYPGMYTRNPYFKRSVPACIGYCVNELCRQLKKKRKTPFSDEKEQQLRSIVGSIVMD